MASSVDVYVVEPDSAYLAAIVIHLGMNEKYKLVGYAIDVETAQLQLSRLRCDLLIAGLETRNILDLMLWVGQAAPETRILAIAGASVSTEDCVAAFHNGAAGITLRTNDAQVFLRWVDDVLAGIPVIATKIAQRILADSQNTNTQRSGRSTHGAGGVNQVDSPTQKSELPLVVAAKNPITDADVSEEDRLTSEFLAHATHVPPLVKAKAQIVLIALANADAAFAELAKMYRSVNKSPAVTVTGIKDVIQNFKQHGMSAVLTHKETSWNYTVPQHKTPTTPLEALLRASAPDLLAKIDGDNEQLTNEDVERIILAIEQLDITQIDKMLKLVSDMAFEPAPVYAAG